MGSKMDMSLIALGLFLTMMRYSVTMKGYNVTQLLDTRYSMALKKCIKID